MTLGNYLPPYFLIRIETDLNLDNLAELPDDVKGTYFHKYCHFLQDLTTTFRIMKTWNVFDRLRQYIFSIQHTDGDIAIP